MPVKVSPLVHIEIVVPDAEEAVAALEKEGAPVLLKFSLRPDAPPIHMMGGEEKVGFRFELVESRTGRETPPSETR